MDYSKNKEKTKHFDKDEEIEDATKYGEFISSYFAWTTPEKQKKRAKELNNMTKENKTNN